MTTLYNHQKAMCELNYFILRVHSSSAISKWFSHIKLISLKRWYTSRIVKSAHFHGRAFQQYQPIIIFPPGFHPSDQRFHFQIKIEESRGPWCSGFDYTGQCGWLARSESSHCLSSDWCRDGRSPVAVGEMLMHICLESLGQGLSALKETKETQQIVYIKNLKN